MTTLFHGSYAVVPSRRLPEDVAALTSARAST